MPLRKFARKLVSVLTVAIVVSSLGWVGNSRGAPTAESVKLAREVPLADLHMHVYGFRTSQPSELLRHMRNNNVRWAGGVGNYQRELQEELGGRYIAAIGSSVWTDVFFCCGPAALQNPEDERFKDLFRQAEGMFVNGLLKGFGEIHINNRNRHNPSHERKIPLDNPVLNSMYGLAEKFGGFVQIHTMIDSGLAEIRVMAKRYPRSLTILSHCLPGAKPEDIDSLFRDHPNIVCEVSSGGTIHIPLGRIFNREGLRENWRQLIERYPDRFFIGTDPCCGLDTRYNEIVSELREKFLPYLAPETLEKVAYKNAVQRFGLPLN